MPVNDGVVYRDGGRFMARFCYFATTTIRIFAFWRDFSPFFLISERFEWYPLARWSLALFCDFASGVLFSLSNILEKMFMVATIPSVTLMTYLPTIRHRMPTDYAFMSGLSKKFTQKTGSSFLSNTTKLCRSTKTSLFSARPPVIQKSTYDNFSIPRDHTYGTAYGLVRLNTEIINLIFILLHSQESRSFRGRHRSNDKATW